MGRVGIDPKDHPIETKRMDLLLGELGKVLDGWRKGVVNPEVIFDQEGRPDWLSITEIRGIPPERRKRFDFHPYLQLRCLDKMFLDL